MNIRKLVLASTWVLTIFWIKIDLIPKDHPWRNRKFTLDDWAAGATEFCYQWSLVMWYCLIQLIVVVTVGILLWH